jgi:hypothetical protein
MSNDPKPSGWSEAFSGEINRAVRSMFGQTLRQLHEVPREMPRQLLAILMQLDGKRDDPPPDGGSEH